MNQDQPAHLANFDVAPLDRELQAIREALVTMRAVAASPVPVFGMRRILASRLHLPIQPSRRERELRHELVVFMDNYAKLLNRLDPSSQPEHGETP